MELVSFIIPYITQITDVLTVTDSLTTIEPPTKLSVNDKMYLHFYNTFYHISRQDWESIPEDDKFRYCLIKKRLQPNNQVI